MVLERLKKGESFTNLAKELSIDKGSAKKGGDLGSFGRGMMVKPFEEAAFKLNKGEVTPCIASKGKHAATKGEKEHYHNRKRLIEG
jgi:foldase protein PrsA